jgi:glycosyltransferase involved in cell wall biosynthesis
MDTFPKYGTSESLQFAQKLQARGHQVMVVTSDRTADGKKNPRTDTGIKTQYVPSFRLPTMPYLLTPSALPEVLAAIRSFEPDVVLAMHYVHFTTNMAVLAARQTKTPCVLGIRGPGTSFGASMANALKKELSRTVGRITISMSTLVVFDCFASMAAYNVSRSEVVYSPVDTSKFEPHFHEGRLTITALGSLTRTKGLEYLLKAVRQLPQARVLIAGEGIDRTRLQGMARPGVEFLGYRTDIQNIMDQTDIFVLPSVSEGISNALLEAGACGKACVASDVGGSPEVIQNGYNGWLFPSKDPAALAARLAALAQDPELRRTFGRNLRATVEKKFDLGKIVDKLEAVLASVAL